MRLPKAHLTALLLSFLLSPALPAERADLPTVDQLLARMTDAVSKVQTFEADVSVAHLNKRTTAVHLAKETSQKDGQTIVREFLSAKMTRKTPDGKELTQQTTDIDDGTFSWTEERDLESNKVMVYKKRPHLSFYYLGPAENLLAVRQGCQLLGITVVTGDTIDGRKMYRLQGSSENAVDGGTIWVDQESLMIRRRFEFSVNRANADEPRKVTKTFDYLNVKLNQPIDPKLFQYTPPEGATVNDQTQPKP